jgi:hypothetical protein
MKILMLLLMAGCTTTPLTEEQEIEREYQFEQEYQEWIMCRKVYDKVNTPWFSHWHMTARVKNGKARPRRWDIRNDLFINNCDYILRRIGYK